MVSVVIGVALVALAFVLDGSVTVELLVVDEVVLVFFSVAVIEDAVVIFMELVLFVSVFSASVGIVD